MQDLVTISSADGVTQIVMSDGKVNIMGPPMLEALHKAFDEARHREGLVVLSSGARHFSAGFDLAVIGSGDRNAIVAMLRAGAELALKILSFPRPVIAVCEGNALPMGAFLLLAADVRIGTEGPQRIGLNEVMIGLTLPWFAVELARQRLTPPYFHRSLLTGEMFAPTEARDAGFLDKVVAPVDLSQTLSEVIKSLSKINFEAHAGTKARMRQQAIAAVQAAIDSELVVSDTHENGD